MLRVTWVVLVKETLDLLRDRRALFFLFAVPLLMPLVGAVGGAFVLWQVVRRTEDGLPVAVVNGEELPGLVTDLRDNAALRMVDPPPDPESALQRGELMAVLEIPPGAGEALEAEETFTLTLTSSRSGWQPDVVVASIDGIVDRYAESVMAERLAERQLDRSWLDPIRLRRRAAAPTGVASAPIAGGGAPTSLASIFIPLTIASWVFSGGLSLVAHMTVGEKERRTMEPLLITPASRVGTVLGKTALSVVVSAVTIGLWSLDSLAYVLALSIVPAGFPGASFALRPGDVGSVMVWLVLLMLPLMTMVNGIVMAACTFAKNYRESQLFLGVLQLLLPGLSLLAAFGVEASPPMATYALPAIGVLVAMRDLFQAGIAPRALALTGAASAAYAVGAILLAAYVFSREWALMRGV